MADSSVRLLQVLARSLAECEPEPASLLPCVAEALNGGGFGFGRVAVFRGGKDSFDSIPAAQHGFDDLEVLHGHLPSVDEWPLFRRAVGAGHAVHAVDAQLHGDVPLEVAGSLRIRSIVGVPFIAGGTCLGFGLCDRGGGAFDVDEEELSLLTTVGQLVATALVPALRLEQERRASELKTQFVALASHELRAPVAGIHGITTTLRERGEELDDGQVEVLNRTLFEQADRMRRLVDQLLDVTKLDAEAIRVNPQRFPVRRRIEEIVRAVVPHALPDVTIDVADELETVADPYGFDRIVSNLVMNAFRYGRPPVRVAAQQLDTHFRLWVEDQGDGVPEEFAPRLFERFARGRPEKGDGGSGLGLAIAQSFAQAHGGRVLYEGMSPNGARFQLVLPARD